MNDSVGDPKLLMHVGLMLMGLKYSSSIFDNVVDFDFTSLYPSIIRLYNIYKATLLGQLVMNPDDVGDREKRVVDEKYSRNRGSKYLDDLELNEAIHFCYRWLNLPNTLAVIKHFDMIFSDQVMKKVKAKRMKDVPVDNGMRKVKITRKVV
jgi:DNA polymerase elongation subunit (family B)